MHGERESIETKERVREKRDSKGKRREWLEKDERVYKKKRGTENLVLNLNGIV